MSHLDHRVYTLDEVVRTNAALPSLVFYGRFEKYVFFDLDVATSFELISGLGKLIESFFGKGEVAEIFSASTQERLGAVTVEEDLPEKLLKIGQSLRNAGDCSGVIIVPASKRWILFQKQPVDIGVIALNCGSNFNRFALDAYGCFFDCEDIAGWLQGLDERDINLRENFGEALLDGLYENYCSC